METKSCQPETLKDRTNGKEGRKEGTKKGRIKEGRNKGKKEEIKEGRNKGSEGGREEEEVG